MLKKKQKKTKKKKQGTLFLLSFFLESLCEMLLMRKNITVKTITLLDDKKLNTKFKRGMNKLNYSFENIACQGYCNLNASMWSSVTLNFPRRKIMNAC